MHFMEGSNYLANNAKLYLEAIISIIDKYISLILAIFYYLLRKLFIINLCQVLIILIELAMMFLIIIRMNHKIR